MARCSAARADYFRHIYVWTDIWQMAGYSAVIYLAALASIDTSRYDAAKVGGANRLQKIIHVDIPGIMPTAIIILILGVGNVMQRTKGKSMDASNRSR